LPGALRIIEFVSEYIKANGTYRIAVKASCIGQFAKSGFKLVYGISPDLPSALHWLAADSDSHQTQRQL
jgi:hypothetical protein